MYWNTEKTQEKPFPSKGRIVNAEEEVMSADMFIILPFLSVWQ